MTRHINVSGTGGEEIFTPDNPGKISLTDSNFQENPNNTKEGQSVVSASESFMARLAREGKFRSATSEKLAVPIGIAATSGATLTCSSGFRLYPTRVSIACTVDAELIIKIVTNLLPNSQDVYIVTFVKGGTPWVVNFDGDVFCLENGSITIQAKHAIAAGELFGSVNGIEVADYV